MYPKSIRRLQGSHSRSINESTNYKQTRQCLAPNDQNIKRPERTERTICTENGANLMFGEVDLL